MGTNIFFFFILPLLDKPNSKKPLSILVEYDDNNVEFYSHPYLLEIERFNPSSEQLAPR